MASKRRHRASTNNQAPAGLVAAFRMIYVDGATSAFADMTADRYYPYARRAIDHLNGRTGEDMESELLLAAEQVAGADRSLAEDPSIVADAAFHVGFAVCWLLMTQVNGGGR